MQKRAVLIVAGPSGVGKTAVAKAVIEHNPRFTFLRSATTRAKRGDAHDDEYLYCTEDEFRALVADGKMLEHMVYDGNMYGTPHSEVERAHSEGKIPLLVLDLNGVDALYHHPLCHTCAIYLYADSDTISSRLDGRDGANPAKVASRLERNKEDFERLPSLRECFYQTIPNASLLEDARDAVIAAFASFESGEPRSLSTDAVIDELHSRK